jgi:hypothetical protein
MNDYAGAREFLMVQESIAALLGVRRVGITVAASGLQAADLITYNRGNIIVLDRPGLGKKSCECYRFIKQQYRSLHRKMPGLLSRK